MVSETDSGMEEERSPMVEEVSSGTTMEETKAPEMEAPSTASKKKSGGRRAALRIIRESVEHVSKDLGNFRKAQDAGSKRLEKQISALRSDIAALKSHIAKETTRVRAKQDAAISRLISKVSAPKPKAVKKKKASKPKKSKGKK
jgi:hypothetical protein